MKTKSVKMMGMLLVAFIMLPSYVGAQELKPIQLPNPQVETGRPLMQVFMERRSLREFSPHKLSWQLLSNILWAACGVNRSADGKLTAPTAHNWQEIDVYLSMEEGTYLYDKKEHLLKQVKAKDIRALTGTQPFVEEAPLNLIYVADYAKMGKKSKKKKDFFAAVDTGFISQNVYLYCASEGLATVVRGTINIHPLAKALNLRSSQQITLAQSIGWPRKRR